MADPRSAAIAALERELRDLESAYAALEESRAAVAASEARFERVFNQIQDVYFELGSEGQLLEISPSVRRQFGHDPASLLDEERGWLATHFLAHPGAGPVLARGESLRDLEIELPDADGVPRPCLISARVVETAEGAGRCVVGSITEISEQRQIEERLRASEERFRTIFRHGPDALVLSDLATLRIVDVNDSFCRLTGWPREAATGALARELGLWDDRTRVAVMGALETEGEVRSHETHIIRRDGRTITTLLTARIVTIDGKPHGLWIARDLGELRESQAALRATAAKFEALFEHAADGICLQDDRGVLVDVNAAMCRQLGRARDDLLSLPWLDLHAPSHRSAAARALERTQLDDECVFETVMFDQHGVPRNFEVSLRRITLERAPAVMAIARDVTQRRTLETQLLQSQKMEAVGLLASGVAHDFNNILTVIRGLAFVLKDALPETHEDQETIDELDKAAERAAGLTRQLLAFSRRQVTTPEDLEVPELIRNLSRMLRRLLPAVIELELELTDDDALAHVDAGQLEQVIANLVVNAKDAIDGAGTITLRCDVANRSPPDAPVAGTSARFVVIEVADTGSGIDPATLSRIFEPFFTTKAKGKGTGLGLATVRDIIHRAHGHIDVSSEVGAGATFSIFLPAIERPEQLAIAATPDRSDLRGAERVLIVDDEASLRRLLVRRFRRLGYTVHEAGDALAAQAALDELTGPLDLLVTDLVMPNAPGTELARAVWRRFPHSRVLFMSGYADDDTLADLPRGPTTDFIQKVFTPDALLRKARALLDRPLEPGTPESPESPDPPEKSSR